MINIKNEPKRYDGVENRVQLFALGLTLVFLAPVFKLWDMQVVNQVEYEGKAEDQRIWDMPLESDRGVIYGKDDVILADNRASVNVVFVPGECPENRLEEVCIRLAKLLRQPANSVLEKVTNSAGNPFEQILIKNDVTKAELFHIEENSFELPGVMTLVRPQRRYLYRETGGQLLGYLGEINRNQLNDPAWHTLGYRQGDVIGQGGLESQYEHQLQGEDGFLLVTKYAEGRPQLRTDRGGMPVLANRDSAGNVSNIEGEGAEPQAGTPLRLTVDIELQRKCESLLTGEVGAIVVLNSETGAVLAMASVPTYDPNVFVSHDPTGERQRLLNANEPKPMLHLAYREQYPPGSVYKIMLAAAALEEGTVTPHTSYYCNGRYRVPNSSRIAHCWKRSGHGSVAVKEALAYSCDVYFYQVGIELGIDKIVEWSHRMGLGQTTGIDLPREEAGLIPDPEWKKAIMKDKPIWDQNWFIGDTVNVSIGQGSAATTPLQNAVMMACIVNGGYRVTPYLNREKGPELSERMFSESTIALVTAGMRMCVDKAPPDYPSGTGWRAGVPGVAVLGKTGTAQVMNLSHHEKYATEEDIPYEFRDHAWFVAGVVDRDPKVAICILVEHGHHGSTAASVLAKPLIEYLYRNQLDLDVQMAQREEKD